jgi:1,4-dihydroxy-2-naphthoate octaprenyltransferase
MEGESMASFQTWAKALRLPFLTATIVPVFLGTAIAWYEVGAFDWILFLLTLIGVAFIHLATNTANDYWDHVSGNDTINKRPTKFSGGSRVIQDKLLKPEQVRNAAFFFLIIGIGIGALLYWMTKNMLLIWFGAAGAVIGFFYTAPPLRLGYRGIGELLTFIGFGPLAVVGTYAVQTGMLSTVALAASVPVGVLIALVLLINEVPDEEADAKVRKNTLVVILGKREAISLYHFFLIAAYLFVMAGILMGSIPMYGVLVLLTLPMAVKAYNASTEYVHDKRQDVRKLMPANGMTIALHLAMGMLLSASYVLASFI